MKEQGKKIMETGNTKDIEVDLEEVGDKVVGGTDLAHKGELKSSQLSQFMEQLNLLTDLVHKRKRNTN